jgi:hypothetical protein
MRVSQLCHFSWMGAVVAFAAAHLGCNSSSSASGGNSAAGESCSRTDDCQSGLVCIANTCSMKGSAADGGQAGLDGTVGTTSGDSAAGLDGRIADSANVADAPGDGGSDGSSGIGDIGNACQTSRDCAPNLACVASTSGGVCTLVNYGLTPTGKTCTGECMQAADCCELPVNLSIYANCSFGGICSYTVTTCQDIVQLALGGDLSLCANMADAGPNVTFGCFYYQTYCACAANTWACNNATCVYTAPCFNSMPNQAGGCAAFSRTRLQLPTTCDLTTNRCLSMGGVGCSTGNDCNDGGITADTRVTCRGSDCTCYQSGCYIKCTKDLDCQAGFTCDTSTNLCVQGSCTNDQQCAIQLGNTRAKCVSSTCNVQCMNDHDCSPAGGPGLSNFTGRVCDPSTKLCVSLGCTTDNDCAATGGNVRTFCVPAPDAGMAIVIHSAITN